MTEETPQITEMAAPTTQIKHRRLQFDVHPEMTEQLETLKRRLSGRRRGAPVSDAQLLTEALSRLRWMFDVEDKGGRLMYRDRDEEYYDVSFDHKK